MEWYSNRKFYEESSKTWIYEIILFPFGIIYSNGEEWFYHSVTIKFLGLEFTLSISDW
jgi:hypothetical protein|tara:strand:- start:11114 stop:11287 length:174 start_codon:yes stop_codon:yes gene_type:complete